MLAAAAAAAGVQSTELRAYERVFTPDSVKTSAVKSLNDHTVPRIECFLLKSTTHVTKCHSVLAVLTLLLIFKK